MRGNPTKKGTKKAPLISTKSIEKREFLPGSSHLSQISKNKSAPRWKESEKTKKKKIHKLTGDLMHFGRTSVG